MAWSGSSSPRLASNAAEASASLAIGRRNAYISSVCARRSATAAWWGASRSCSATSRLRNLAVGGKERRSERGAIVNDLVRQALLGAQSRDKLPKDGGLAFRLLRRGL